MGRDGVFPSHDFPSGMPLSHSFVTNPIRLLVKSVKQSEWTPQLSHSYALCSYSTLPSYMGRNISPENHPGHNQLVWLLRQGGRRTFARVKKVWLILVENGGSCWVQQKVAARFFEDIQMLTYAETGLLLQVFCSTLSQAKSIISQKLADIHHDLSLL